MLSFLFSIPILAAAGWLTAKTVARMWRLKAGWAWWGTLGVVVAAGAYAGFRLALCEFQTAPNFRWVGLPLPSGFFVWEEDRWTDFIPPPPVQWTNLPADVLAPVLVLMIPLFLFWRRRERVRGIPGPGEAIPGG